MASVREDFGKFIRRGDLITLAVAFMMGVAFNALISAMVADIFNPLIGVAGHIDFSTWTYTLNGSVFFQGLFLNQLISFIIITLVVFFLIALPYQRYMDRQAAKKAKATVAAAATTRACPECLTQIPLAAKRCSACASPVSPMA